jgi:hypothetical protein
LDQARLRCSVDSLSRFDRLCADRRKANDRSGPACHHPSTEGLDQSERSTQVQRDDAVEVGDSKVEQAFSDIHGCREDEGVDVLGTACNVVDLRVVEYVQDPKLGRRARGCCGGQTALHVAIEAEHMSAVVGQASCELATNTPGGAHECDPLALQ